VTWRRVVLVVALLAAAAGAAAWYWQSALIGVGARFYLARIAAREEATGDLSQRRATVRRMNRMLLMGPPPDTFVPELFDFITAVSARVATGEIDLAWAAYVYTSYQRDLIRDRPQGPRRSSAEVGAAVEEYVRFYSLRQRPDVPGFSLSDLAGAESGESYTVEELDEADRQGRPLGRVTPQR